MAISSFPNGFASGVTVRGIPLLTAYPNKIYWVDSTTGSNGNKGTDTRPFATIDYAIGRCTANKGDIIVVKPGHTETVSTAAGIDLDVAGVAVVGLGVGSLRPTINISATGGFVDFSAPNCLLKNVLITGGIDAVVKAVLIDAADSTMDGVEIRDVTGEVTEGVLTTANAVRAKILNHIHNGAAGAGTNAAIAIVGGSGIEITIDRMDGNFAVGGINVKTTATTDLYVHDVLYFRTRNAADIFLVDTITASTGQIGPNIYLRLQDNAANITEACTGATFVYHQPISIVNNAGEVGMQTNITASTDA